MRWISVVLLISFISLVSCARVEQPTPDALVLFNQAEQQIAAQAYQAAVKSYETLELNYPLSEYNEAALKGLIRAYYASGNYLTAGAVAARYVRLYPRGADIDYAYFIKGMSNYHQERGVFAKFFNMDLTWRDPGSQAQAYDDFAILARRFPNSPYTPKARAKLAELRDRAARKEYDLAKFYLKDRKYVAARNRAANVISHFAESQYVDEAKQVYDQANQALQLSGFHAGKPAIE